jgi:hypothetical protein
MTTRTAAVVGLTAAAVVLLAAPPWHGPILFSVSPGHGLDLGDVAALAVGVLAARLALPLLLPRRGQLGFLARSDAALAGLGLVLGFVGLLDLTRAYQRLGTAYDVLAPILVIGAGAWAAVAATLDPVLWPATVRTTVARATVVLLGGLLLDAAATPSGTLFGTAALAVHLAVRSRRSVARVVFAAIAALMVLLSAASLADIAGIDVLLSRSGGGAFRSAALVAVLGAGTALEWSRPAATPGRS